MCYGRTRPKSAQDARIRRLYREQLIRNAGNQFHGGYQEIHLINIL